MTKHKWQFTPRFRRHAFGWRSDAPIQRIKEALAEIRQVARKDPVLAAEGAVLLLEKLSPALEQVDSSSGAIGSAVNKAIETLVAVIAKADVESSVRQAWLQRLWQALDADDIPYLELLGDYWGELCVTPELAAQWAAEFLPAVEHAWGAKPPEYRFFNGTTACLSALFAAGHYDALLALIDKSGHNWWDYRRWGVKALVAKGKKAEAIRYAEGSRGLNDPGWQIARECEAILLSSGLKEEAYTRYALEATPGTTYLARFRAIAKKYPHKPAEDILNDLIASTPGNEGKWFAAAKDAGLFDLALELATRSPADPRTLIRAARDYAGTQPAFALAVGYAALRWMGLGYGYEITGGDVVEAWSALVQAAAGVGLTQEQLEQHVLQVIAGPEPGNQFIRSVLM